MRMAECVLMMSANMCVRTPVCVCVQEEDAVWNEIKPEVFSAIMDHFASGEPIIRAAATGGEAGGDVEHHPHQIAPDDSETVQMIKELLETRYGVAGALCTKDSVVCVSLRIC